MRKRLLFLLCLLSVCLLAACGSGAPLVVVTPERAEDENTYDTAQALLERYGDTLAHAALPAAATADAAAYAAALSELGADPAVRALVLAPALPGAAEAVAALRESRGDELLIIFSQPAEAVTAAAPAADIVLDLNRAALGEAVAAQAAEYEAPALICYQQDPAADAYGLLAAAETLGLAAESCALPADAAALAADIAAWQAVYGPDCAFVTTSPQWEEALLTACVEAGAIMPLPLSVDPYAVFPALAGAAALPQNRYDGLTEYLDSLKSYLVNDLGQNERFATWRRPGETMLLDAACSYAQGWLQGLAAEKVDAAYLRQQLLNADGRLIDDRSAANTWLCLPNRYAFSSLAGTGCDC